MNKRMGAMMNRYVVCGVLWVSAAAGMEPGVRRRSSSFSALPEQPLNVLMGDDMKSYMIIKRSDGTSILLALKKKDEQITLLENFVKQREADGDILNEEIEQRDKRIEYLKRKLRKVKEDLEKTCRELDSVVRSKTVTAKHIEDLRQDMEFLVRDHSSRSSSQSSTPLLNNSPQLSIVSSSHSIGNSAT